MKESKPGKVVKVKAEKNPNGQILKWLREWQTQSSNDGLMSKFTFIKAANSLRKYPLKIKCGNDCRLLDGFGPKLCSMIDQRLAESEMESSENAVPTRRSRVSDVEKGSHSYGILMALGENGEPQRQNKSNIIEKARKYISPVNQCENDKIWKQIKNLVKLKYVEKKSTTEYCLTSGGRDVIDALDRPGQTGELGSSPLIFPAPKKRCEPPATKMERIPAPACPTRVTLYVDNCEICGNRNNKLFDELRRFKIDFCATKLSVGDFLWVSSRHTEQSIVPHDDDVVLDFIIERKRIDDLASSIVDGRLHEQKHRLKQTGLRNIFYVVEDKRGSCSLNSSSLQQAICNIETVDGIRVRRTVSPSSTAKFIAAVDGVVKRSQSGGGIPFGEFSRLFSKTTTVTAQALLAQVLGQIDGMSLSKSAAITERYLSLSGLMRAYRACAADDARVVMLAGVVDRGRKIGPVLSRSVYRLLYSEIW